MILRQSEWQQTIRVLKSSHDLWGAGLSKSAYIEFLNQQMTHPYGKRNLRFMVYEKDGEVVSSCKLYQLDMKLGSTTLPILGIGAIFTPPSKRGQGHAGQMLELVLELAEDEDFQGAVLYSEIGTEFYRQHGFIDLGETNFVIDLINANKPVQNYIDRAKMRQHITLNLEPLIAYDQATLDFLNCHYQRWLSHHQLRFQRSADFWSFKIMKERYLSENSNLSWPQIHLLKSSTENGKAGYAIVEWATGKLRILETIGTESAMHALWLDIITLALNKHCNYIHGWVGTAPDNLGQLYTFERDWGRSMILPLSDKVDELLDEDKFHPCPFLELDHL